MGRKCIGIKRTDGVPVGEWKDNKGALFAHWIACMGLIQREIDDDRFTECPCLLINVQQRGPADLLTTMIYIIQQVGQNKLTELRAFLASKGLGVKDDTVTRSSDDKGKTTIASATTAGYDKNAEFRARLRALKRWLQRNRGHSYEGFDIGLKPLPVENEGWFEMNGPIYIFMQNWGNDIVARVVFPSMTKEGAPFLNYDNLAKSHRWIERLINSSLYTNGAACDAPCNNSIITHSDYKYNWRKARCMRKKFYMPCGNAQRSKKVDGNTKLWNSAVYEVNVAYPAIASILNKARIKQPVYSILPSDWDMYAGARYILMSENRKWFMMLAGDTLGVYENKKNQDLVAFSRGQVNNFGGVYKYGIKFKGTGIRVSLETSVLTVYGKPATGPSTDDNEILWSMELAKEGVQPMALYLGDDGKLMLFDGDNRNVLDAPAFDAVLDHTEKTVEFGAYSQEDEYQKRLLQLLDWLRARGLMKEYLPATVVQYVVQELEFNDLAPDAPFDEKTDYRGRLLALFEILHRTFPNLVLPSDEEVKTFFETRATYEAEENATNVVEYDPTKVMARRLTELA